MGHWNENNILGQCWLQFMIVEPSDEGPQEKKKTPAHNDMHVITKVFLIDSTVYLTQS